jgi:uncharacterized protein (DUF433 family)
LALGSHSESDVAGAVDHLPDSRSAWTGFRGEVWMGGGDAIRSERRFKWKGRKKAKNWSSAVGADRRMRNMGIERISIEPANMGGQPCVRGLPITVWDVFVALASHDMTGERVLENIPAWKRRSCCRARIHSPRNPNQSTVSNCKCWAVLKQSWIDGNSTRITGYTLGSRRRVTLRAWIRI